LLVMASLVALKCHHMSQQRCASNSELRSCLLALKPRPDQLFVNWGGRSLCLENIDPFENNNYLLNLRIVAFGTSNRRPPQKNMLQHFGISDILQAFYEKDNVFLFLQSAHYPAISKLYSVYVKEHYGVSVHLIKRFECGSLLALQVAKTYE
jgi:hypothetical protein